MYVIEVSPYIKIVPILLRHHNPKLHLFGIQITSNIIFHSYCSGAEENVTAKNYREYSTQYQILDRNSSYTLGCDFLM